MTQEDRDQFTSMKIDVDYIKKDVSETKKQATELNNKMTKIHNKLFNDEETGEDGYFSLTKQYGIRLTKLENIKVALISLLMAIGGIFGWIANNIIGK